MSSRFLHLALFSLFAFLPAAAHEQERLYLSGTGLGDTRTWEFFCTEGRRSGAWTTIEVPSQWELQGFGAYCYGRWYKEGPKQPPREKGVYRRMFDVPAAWRGKAVRIVFEGVMTDTEVRVNGRAAGTVHRGGFNEFSYDVTQLLRYGRRNAIEVTVSKESADKSVNAAERKADWWIFGGIYRPVYLEARPAVHIERLALDPRTDGRLRAVVRTSPLKEGCTLTFTLDGAQPRTVSLAQGTCHTVETAWDGVRTWDPEHPNLYALKATLCDARGRTLHTLTERIGFRTVEVRPGDGLYVNGTKVVLKGINRHSFHPDGGRTTNAQISRRDGELIKEMNMNAVRVHYAPDRHFLDVCDSLGLFVVDELAGWQNAYSTAVGERLQEEFVARDVNRPSVILWSNGNEGGWNTALDARFAQLDPQRRCVVHPWADFGPIDTHHYPAYQTGVARFTQGRKIFMPTEFMHGMYDQGHGAGLEDFWAKYTASPLFAGGFMWDFSDNAVRRTDRGGALDSDGSNGADGILGPYREKEGSYYAVRDIWAPVQFEELRITASFDGRMLVRNDYLFTDLRECSASYRLLRIPGPETNGPAACIASGEVVLPRLEPRCTGYARMVLPERFFDADVLEVTVFHPSGLPAVTRTWPVHRAAEYAARVLPTDATDAKACLHTAAGTIVLQGADVTAAIDPATGMLAEVRNAAGRVPFGGGPAAVGMNTRVDRTVSRMEGDTAVVTVYYKGAVDSIRWEMTGGGLLRMNARVLDQTGGGKGFDDALTERDILNFGFTFDCPEEQMQGVRWFGRGPYRVWKNRIRGTQYGIWEKAYNDTQTGAAYERLIYPEFKGYHADLRWAVLHTAATNFTVYSLSDGVFLRLYTPGEPVDNKAHRAYPAFPAGDVSFLYEIPAMRSFKPVEEHGPRSQPGHIRVKKGDEGIPMRLVFDFRSR